ncbi:sigma factor-like helix-turn-helix DNA-binding protein [Xanthobacter pseudotagetidis]|uniref:sigma factor-like helix-turn-helix DNA-binding protein n=1 Tax=Xanthobacter pseudotagetidis TaxID=3119911 RepID=UPI00372C8DC0
MALTREVQDLIVRVAEDDRRALADLYRLSGTRLYGIVLRLLRRPDRAEEAMRLAFLRIHAQATQYQPEDEPVSWLVAIARASALDIARAHDEAAAFEPFHVPPAAVDPLRRRDRSSALARLLGCLGALSEERRRMVLLAYYDGWSREALSVYFDAPVATVRAWLARSSSEIATCLTRRP